MTEQELAKLLGRPLTATEIANRDLYLEIAKENLEELLCISLDKQGDTPTAEPRVFDVREGYSTVFTDIFTNITSVEINGNAVTDYTKMFWDKRSNDFYNSIVLGDCERGDTVTITALWGFVTIPSDLQRLWAQSFANVAKSYQSGSGNVKSKRVEDFDITYGDLSDDELLISQNERTISKYSLCSVGYVRHGRVCNIHRSYHCAYCI